MNLPNKLTMARIIAVPFFIAAYIMGHEYISAIIFIIASITDAFDGHIARSRGLVTNFGKIMDPLADKILVISALVVLVEDGMVPGWMLIVILAREFIVAGLRTVAAADGIVIAAGISGKVKTVFQMIAVPLLLMHNYPFSVYIPAVRMDYYTLWICVIATIISGTEYVYKNREVFLKGGI